MKKKKTWAMPSAFVLILGFCLCTIGLALIWKSTPNPQLEKDPASGFVLYEVTSKLSLGELSTDLQAKGLIPEKHLFKWFLRLTQQDRKIRAGYYYLSPSNSTLKMAWKLTTGKMATRSVSIPEGKASWEIYSLINNIIPIDSLQFDSLVHSQAFAKEQGIHAPSLEGYLFPETYVLPLKISAHDILKIMTQQFHTVIGDVAKDSPVIQKYGVNGWITLASIVEKEAAVKSEQSLIAGVFYKRLQLGWSLGADPTVRFILHKLTGPLYASELDNNSPYNTRKFPGLPPGPICSPGKMALLASLNPPETNNLYFVAKDDGSREHFFSRNNEEHMRYKSRAAANRGK